jgi:hypothetical protein
MEDMEETLVRKPVRVAVSVSDGSVIEGFIIISRHMRLSDVLNNNKKDFIVLLEAPERSRFKLNRDKTPHILNKRHIVKITEIEGGSGESIR